MQSDHSYYPGLEAVPPTHEDKQVVSNYTGLIPSEGYPGYPKSPVSQSHQLIPTTTTHVRKKPRWVLPLASLVLAVLTGIIGGIIGWKVTEGKANNAAQASCTAIPSSSGCTSGSTTGVSRTIRPNSGLTATGWRYGSDFKIRIFYQGPDNAVRYSNYDSLFKTWSVPVTLSTSAMTNTPLAATVILWQGGLQAVKFPFSQIQMYYLDSSSKLLGQNWIESTASTGSIDSINGYSFTVGPGTQVATYWPSIILQQASGSIQEIVFNSTSLFSPPADLSIVGSPGTALLVLPLTTSHEGTEMRLVYRHPDGQLHTFDRSSTGGVQDTSGGIGFTVPSNSPLAGFATARGDSTVNVDTVILWQDRNAANASTGGIFYGYQKDSKGWKGPFTDAVFAGADVPTQLTCVTAAMTGGGAPNTATFPLQAGKDMNRCYFQVGGALKEVYYDGASWQQLGLLPMP